MHSAVLDASALLAYLQDEEGAAVVEEALAAGAAISAANWAEVLSKLSDAGEDPRVLVADLAERGFLGGNLDVLPLDPADALAIATLRPPTRVSGLSLADRACLALATRLGLPALTTDSAWVNVQTRAIVRLLR
jgi:ribonuclease VapC